MSPEYTESIHQGQSTNQEHKVQKSMKPLTEKKEKRKKRKPKQPSPKEY